jgi:hypothetical protein
MYYSLVNVFVFFWIVSSSVLFSQESKKYYLSHVIALKNILNQFHHVSVSISFRR